MSPLHALLYAAHASGSHHKLALRALELMRTTNAEEWRRLMLSRSRLLMEGSKEPDKSFRDFQNHVFHPVETSGEKPRGEFGGAPATAEKWYARLVDMLELQRWDDAVHAAGVLSHYLSDPLMPLHTGSSDAETHVHRGVEWTISRDFEALWSSEDANAERQTFAEQSEDKDVSDVIREEATKANASYDGLIKAYDADVGRKTPERGLNSAGRKIATAQLPRAAAVIAAVFDKAIEDAGVEPPKVNLTLRTAIAALGIPFAWVRKKLDDMEERSAVNKIYREIEKTGALVKNIPAERRTVRIALELAEKGEAPAEISSDAPASSTTSRRGRLTRDSMLEQAPSIGPKTAARLARLGLKTVGDLLSADPVSVAAQLDDRRMPATTVSKWRDQAGLLVRMPRLRRSDAVLLVASGCRDVESLASKSAETLQQEMQTAAARPEVARALRSAKAPSLERVRRIILEAQTEQQVAA